MIIMRRHAAPKHLAIVALAAAVLVLAGLVALGSGGERDTSFDAGRAAASTQATRHADVDALVVAPQLRLERTTVSGISARDARIPLVALVVGIALVVAASAIRRARGRRGKTREARSVRIRGVRAPPRLSLT
jgi:hypothetical protein